MWIVICEERCDVGGGGGICREDCALVIVVCICQLLDYFTLGAKAEMLPTAENDGHFHEFPLLESQIWILLDEVSIDSWGPVEQWASRLSLIRTGHIGCLQYCGVLRSKTLQLVT